MPDKKSKDTSSSNGSAPTRKSLKRAVGVSIPSSLERSSASPKPIISAQTPAAVSSPSATPAAPTSAARARSKGSTAPPRPAASVFAPAPDGQTSSNTPQPTRERSLGLQGYKAQAVQQQLQNDILGAQVRTAMQLLATLTWFVKDLSESLMVHPVNAPDFKHIKQHAMELQSSIEGIDPSREAPTEEQLILLQNINATIKNYFVTLQKFVNQKIKVLNKLGNEDSEKITPNLIKFIEQISDYLEIIDERDVLDQKRALQEKHGYALRYSARSAQQDCKIVSKALSGEAYQSDFFERTIDLDSKVDIEKIDQYTSALVALMHFVEAYTVLAEAAHGDLSKTMDSTIKPDDRAPKELRAIAFVEEKIIKGNLVARIELERLKKRAQQRQQQPTVRQGRASIEHTSRSRFHVAVEQYQRDDQLMLRQIESLQKEYENKEVYVLAYEGGVDNTWLLCRERQGRLDKVMVRDISGLRDFNKRLEQTNYSVLKNDDKANFSIQVLLYLKAGKTYNNEDIRLLQKLAGVLKRASFNCLELEPYTTNEFRGVDSSKKPKALLVTENAGLKAAGLISQLSGECKLHELSAILFDGQDSGMIYDGLRLLKQFSEPFKAEFVKRTSRELGVQQNNGGSNNGHAPELPDLIDNLSEIIYLSPLSGAMRFDSCAKALLGQDDLNAFRKKNPEEYLLFLISFIRKGNKFTRTHKSSSSNRVLKRAVKEDLTDPEQMLERVHFAYERLKKMGANSKIEQYKGQEDDALQLAAVHKGILQRVAIQEVVDSGRVADIFSALVEMVHYVMTTEFNGKKMGAEDALPILISIFFNYFLSDKNTFKVIATVLRAFEKGQNKLSRLNLPCYYGYLNLAAADQYTLVSTVIACQATVEHIGRYNASDKIEINEVIEEKAPAMQAAMEQFIVEDALDKMILGYFEDKTPNIFKNLDEIYVMLDRVSKQKASSPNNDDSTALPSYIAPKLVKNIIHALEAQSRLGSMDQLTPSDSRRILYVIEYILSNKSRFTEANLHTDLFKYITQSIKANPIEKRLTDALELLGNELTFGIEKASAKAAKLKAKRLVELKPKRLSDLFSSRDSKSDDIASSNASAATDKIKGPARKLRKMLKSDGLLDNRDIVAELEEIYLVLNKGYNLSQTKPAEQIKDLLLEMRQKMRVVNQKEAECSPVPEKLAASAPQEAECPLVPEELAASAPPSFS